MTFDAVLKIFWFVDIDWYVSHALRWLPFLSTPLFDAALREAWQATHLNNAEKKESSRSKGGRGDL